MRRLVILCTVAMLVLLAVVSAVGCQMSPAAQHNDRGMELAEAGQLEEAIAEFTKAIELDPDLAMAYYNRALMYLNAGEYDKAHSRLHQGHRAGPRLRLCLQQPG